MDIQNSNKTNNPRNTPQETTNDTSNDITRPARETSRGGRERLGATKTGRPKQRLPPTKSSSAQPQFRPGRPPVRPTSPISNLRGVTPGSGMSKPPSSRIPTRPRGVVAPSDELLDAWDIVEQHQALNNDNPFTDEVRSAWRIIRAQDPEYISRTSSSRSPTTQGSRVSTNLNTFATMERQPQSESTTELESGAVPASSTASLPAHTPTTRLGPTLGPVLSTTAASGSVTGPEALLSAQPAPTATPAPVSELGPGTPLATTQPVPSQTSAPVAASASASAPGMGPVPSGSIPESTPRSKLAPVNHPERYSANTQGPLTGPGLYASKSSTPQPPQALSTACQNQQLQTSPDQSLVAGASFMKDIQQQMNEQYASLQQLAREEIAGHHATHQALQASHHAIHQVLQEPHKETQQAQTQQLKDNLQIFLNVVMENLGKPMSEIEAIQNEINKRMEAYEQASRDVHADDIAMSNTPNDNSAQQWSSEEIEAYELKQHRAHAKAVLYDLKGHCRLYVDDEARTKLELLPALIKDVKPNCPFTTRRVVSPTIRTKLSLNIDSFTKKVETHFQKSKTVMIMVLYKALDEAEGNISQAKTPDELADIITCVKDVYTSGVESSYLAVKLYLIKSFRKVWMPFYSLVQDTQNQSDFVQKWQPLEMRFCEIIGYKIEQWQDHVPSEEDLKEHDLKLLLGTALLKPQQYRSQGASNNPPVQQHSASSADSTYVTSTGQHMIEPGHGLPPTQSMVIAESHRPSNYSVQTPYQSFVPSMPIYMSNPVNQGYSSMQGFQNQYSQFGQMAYHPSQQYATPTPQVVINPGMHMPQPTPYTMPQHGVPHATLQPGCNQMQIAGAGIPPQGNPHAVLALTTPPSGQREASQNRADPLPDEEERDFTFFLI